MSTTVIYFIATVFIYSTVSAAVEKQASYPPAGYRPRVPFNLPLPAPADREGRNYNEEEATTADNVLFETTTAITRDDETTTIAVEEYSTTEYRELQGNKAERLEINPENPIWFQPNSML